MARKVGIESQPAPPAKIKMPKLGKAYKGKALRGPKPEKPRSRPAGGGSKGY